MGERFDQYGKIEFDERGYGHRGSEYAQRFALLDRVAGLDNPWRPNRDGTYSTTFPVYSEAQRQLTARTAMKLNRAAPGAASFGALPDTDAPSVEVIEPKEPAPKGVPWYGWVMGGVILMALLRR